MKNFALTLIAVSTALAGLNAQAATAPAAQSIDTTKSEVAFVSKQMGVPVQGHFRTFDAQLSFDPKQPETGTVKLSIDLGSATLGSPQTDAELAKPDWFNVAKFPKASFQSTAIKAVGANRFDVSGKLLIKGNSRDLVVPVTLATAGTQTTAAGMFVIKRLDFKIGEGDWADTSMVANDVQVKFKLLLKGVTAP